MSDLCEAQEQVREVLAGLEELIKEILYNRYCGEVRYDVLLEQAIELKEKLSLIDDFL